MRKAQYPATLHDFEVKFWRYSAKDLVRIGVLAVPAWLLAGLPGLIVGGTVGIALSEITVDGKTLEALVWAITWHYIEDQRIGVDGETGEAVLVTEDGMVAGLVHVDSVDLDMASDEEWAVNQGVLADLYQEIEYPIELQSRKRSVELPASGTESDEVVVTDHFVVIRDFPEPRSLWPWQGSEIDTFDERVERVRGRCQQISQALNAGDLSAHHVTGEELEEVINRFEKTVVAIESRRFTVQRGEKCHHRTLTVSKYPEELPVGLLSDLLNAPVPGYVEIVQGVEPVTEKQQRKLGRLVGRLQVEAAVTPDLLRGSDLERKVRDATALIEAEATDEERLVNHAVYIVVRGSTPEEVDETVEAVARLLRRRRIEFTEPWYRTPQTFRTVFPFRRDQLGNSILMPAQSAAASFCFSTHETIEKTGVSFGTDTRNGKPVLLDRYSWEAGDIARMGKKGSGKSFSAKLSLIRAVRKYDDLRVYVLDPKQEYGDLVDRLNGHHIVLGEADLSKARSEENIIRYTVKDRSRDNTEQLVDALRHVYREVSQDERKKIILVDEAWHWLENPAGRSVLSQLVREGRDISACLDIITQNSSDFTKHDQGRKILMNLNGFLFFRHQDVANSVRDFFHLSGKEAVELKKLRTGNQLPYSEAIIRGPVNTKLRITASPDEYELLEGTPKPVADDTRPSSEEKFSMDIPNRGVSLTEAWETVRTHVAELATTIKRGDRL